LGFTQICPVPKRLDGAKFVKFKDEFKR